MAISGYIAVAALTIGSTVTTIQGQKKAAREEKRARKVENAVGALADKRAQQERIAQSRVEQAEQISQGEASGTSESSALFASLGASTSTAAGDIGFANARTGAAAGAAAARDRGTATAQRFGTIAGGLNAASSIMSLGASVAATPQAMSLFSGKKKETV